MAKRLNMKWLIGVAAAALIVGGVVAYTNGQPLAVRVASVENNVPIQVFGLGTVEAQAVSRIGFETAGTLIELKADHGDTVKAGTLLARPNFSLGFA